jgi:hypothetical protein
MTMLPRHAAEAVGHALDADTVMVNADMSERRAYEKRAAASEPTPLEQADEEKQPVG